MIKIKCENMTCNNRFACPESFLTKHKLLFCSKECAEAYNLITGEIPNFAKGIEYTQYGN